MSAVVVASAIQLPDDGMFKFIPLIPILTIPGLRNRSEQGSRGNSNAGVAAVLTPTCHATRDREIRCGAEFEGCCKARAKT